MLARGHFAHRASTGSAEPQYHLDGPAVPTRAILHLTADFNHRWTLPGGGIDPGEDPADAVVREVFEESGYHVEVDDLLGIDNLVVPGEKRLKQSDRYGVPLQNLRIVYRAHITGGELTPEAEGSTDDVAWFTPSEIDRLNRVELIDTARRWAGLIN